MSEPSSRPSYLEALQAIGIVITLGSVLGGGFLAYGTLKAIGEANRDDIADARTQGAQQWADVRSVLREIEIRLRTLEMQQAEMRAVQRNMQGSLNDATAGR